MAIGTGTWILILLGLLVIAFGGSAGWSAQLRKCDPACTDDGKKCRRSWKFWDSDYPNCTCNGGAPCPTTQVCTKGATGTYSCKAKAPVTTEV